MRYLLLGAQGQLGQELHPLLLGEVIAPDRSALDLSKPDTIAGYLDQVRPDVVLNCAAYNLVDRAESEPALALTVNALAVRELARWLGQKDRLLVHFSTDHVFGLDERRQTPYTERDRPGPVSVYGASKLAGEQFAQAYCRRHLIVRTCGLYGWRGKGGKGTNFVETMLRLASESRPIRVVSDQICTPTSAADLARETIRLLHEGCLGVQHRTNEGACSWHEFASTIFRILGLRIVAEPIRTEEYGALARRPRYSVLKSQLPSLRPWTEAVENYLAERSRRTALQAA